MPPLPETIDDEQVASLAAEQLAALPPGRPPEAAAPAPHAASPSAIECCPACGHTTVVQQPRPSPPLSGRPAYGSAAADPPPSYDEVVWNSSMVDERRAQGTREPNSQWERPEPTCEDECFAGLCLC